MSLTKSGLWKKQRYRDRSVLEGDRNTEYFQTVGNQRRKTAIHMMEGPEGPVHSTKGIQQVAMDYYKLLFKYEAMPNIDLDDHFFDPEDKLSSD